MTKKLAKNSQFSLIGWQIADSFAKIMANAQITIYNLTDSYSNT